MPLFRFSSKDRLENTVTLYGDEAHHLARVLRAKVGDVVELTDEQYHLFEAEIISTTKEVSLKIVKELKAPPPPYSIHLYLPLIKPENMEWVAEKITELNIDALHLVSTKYCNQREIKENKWERLLKITAESQKQCGRLIPLQIFPPENFDVLISKSEKGTHFFCSEKREGQTFKEAVGNKPAPYHIWIGPEGGWSEEETRQALSHNLIPITLAPLILRAETAALCAVSSLLSCLK